MSDSGPLEPFVLIFGVLTVYSVYMKVLQQPIDFSAFFFFSKSSKDDGINGKASGLMQFLQICVYTLRIWRMLPVDRTILFSCRQDYC